MADGGKKKPNPYFQGSRSDHFNGTRFFNPGGIAPNNFRALLKWQFSERGKAWPRRFDSTHAPALPEKRVEGARLRVTMVGHATMLIQTAGVNILTDPVWSERASPFSMVGPKRVNDPGIRLADLPPIDLVLVSHNHYDHLDLRTLKLLNQDHAPLILTPLGNDAIIRPAVPNARFIVTDWGDRSHIHDHISIDTEPCHHWSARWSGDRRMALWAAFVINTPYGKIYHIGDTGFHGGINYRNAAEKHGLFRLALLPIGAYEPRWFMSGQHQNPEEAVQGMQLANAAHAIGHHWGTFKLTNEAIDAPPQALTAALDEAGIEQHHFRALRPGEHVDIPEL